MSQPALSLPGIAPFPPPTPSRAACDPALQFPVHAKRLEMDRLPESFVADGNCLKGAGFAIFFELLAALSLYGGWLLWKILR